MEEGTILSWLVPDGEQVSRGQELVEIETDKANMTYESDQEGVLEIVAAEGEYQAAVKLGQAADIITQHPVALQLRTLQTMAEISVEKNSTIIFPAQFMSTVQEAIFVPPPGFDSGNGEGYVMQLVDRHATGTTDLLILDAQRIDAEPVATLRIPIRMPGGLHGNWVTDEQLATRAG